MCAIPITINLLCRIYRGEGYYLSVNDDVLKSIAEEVGASIDDVSNVIKALVDSRYFSGDKYEEYNILTSEEIQVDYIKKTKRRNECHIKDEFMVIVNNNELLHTKTSYCKQKPINVNNNELLHTETNELLHTKTSYCKQKPINVNNNSNQQKEKESTKEKEKETQKEKLLLCNSKKKNIKTNEEIVENRKNVFYDSLVPYVGKYKKEMVRRFYDYWTELNRSGTKMRFELEKTFEIGKRLKTWSDREKCYSRSCSDIGVVLSDNSVDKYSNEDKWNR